MNHNVYELSKIYVGKIPYNSDLLEEVNKFLTAKNIRSGKITIIGAVKSAKVGYYCQNAKSYEIHSGEVFEKGMEILTCTGNISIKDCKPFAHLHIVLSDKDGNAFGGHLMPGTIVFAGEFCIEEYAGDDLVRGYDEVTGLPLWGNL